jgi:quercetin dioxygenase-like cupin family protein
MNAPTPAAPPMNDDINLPAEIVEPMAEAVRDAPLDAMAERFMKSRLMTRVADFERTAATLTVRPDQGVWEKFSPRIKMKVLKREADGSSMSYLLKLEAGAFLVPHTHSIDEECVVLEGEVTIGDERVGPGTYHLAPRGLVHAAIRSERGAILFIRGKEPSWRDTAVKATLRALLR